MTSNTVGAYALSEASSGSDAFAMQTRAELKGNEYVLNGRKLWITNGKEAGVFVLFATLDPAAGYKGITAFIVEKTFSGFSVDSPAGLFSALKPENVFSTMNAVMPLYPAAGSSVVKQDKDPRLFTVGDPQLAAVQHIFVALKLGARLHGKSI